MYSLLLISSSLKRVWQYIFKSRLILGYGSLKSKAVRINPVPGSCSYSTDQHLSSRFWPSCWEDFATQQRLHRFSSSLSEELSPLYHKIQPAGVCFTPHYCKHHKSPIWNTVWGDEGNAGSQKYIRLYQVWKCLLLSILDVHFMVHLIQSYLGWNQQSTNVAFWNMKFWGGTAFLLIHC